MKLRNITEYQRRIVVPLQFLPPSVDPFGNEVFCYAMEAIAVFGFCHRAFGGTVIAAVRQVAVQNTESLNNTKSCNVKGASS